MIRLLFAATIITIFATGCGGPAPQPPGPNADSLFDLYMSSAQLEFQHDSLASAAAAYAKALSRAETMDNPANISSAAYSLAICRAALGEYPAALTLLQEAEHESQRIAGPTSNILLARGRIYLLMNDPTQAVQSAEGVLSGKPDDDQRCEALLIRGTARLHSDDLPGAVDDLKQANSLASKLSDLPLQAGLSGLSGEIHMKQKDFSAATADFDNQAELCRQNHAYRQMARALASAGKAADAAGQFEKAADRFYRAARSTPTDADMRAQALAAAQKAGDEQLIRLISSLPATQPTAP